jgi:hypothetical protein
VTVALCQRDPTRRGPVAIDGRLDHAWSPLFGKSDQKAAEEEAGRAELERLLALSAKDLAVEILPAVGPGGIRISTGGGYNTVQVTQWLMRNHKRRPNIKPLIEPVREAIQVLENAGLVLRTTSGIGTGVSSVKATRLGEQVLSEGTVRQYLDGSAQT